MAKNTQPKKTWKYSREFKIRAVELSYQEGLMVKDVAEGLDIHPYMLSRWRKNYREGKLETDGRRRKTVSKNKNKPTKKKYVDELTALNKRIEQLEKENNLLKKWQRYLSEQHQKNLDS
jgi:transposase